MSIHHVVALAGLFLGLTTASSASSGPLPPSQDPWYTAPLGYENVEPGSVLRVRLAPESLTEVIGNASAAYNILYRTTDSLYKPTWAVTTLLVPELGPNSTAAKVFNQSALLSYQVPYDSADLDASPSYSIYQTNAVGLLGEGLGLGLFVSVPDYEGPLASFTSGVISGHATIDSVRAVLSLGLGLDVKSPRVALWGYSGGALASEWASELLEPYAPELSGTVLGAALGGLTPNVSSVLESIDGTSNAGLAPSAFLGLISQFPQQQQYFLSQLKTTGPRNEMGFLAARNFTVKEAAAAYAGQNIGDYFKNGDTIFKELISFNIVNRDGIMGYHGVPRIPLFLYKSVKDEISKISDTDALVEKYCQVGANIRYERNSVGTHAQEATSSLETAVQWLAAVLTGQYSSHYSTVGCTILNVTRESTGAVLKREDVPDTVFNLW